MELASRYNSQQPAQPLIHVLCYLEPSMGHEVHTPSQTPSHLTLICCEAKAAGFLHGKRYRLYVEETDADPGSLWFSAGQLDRQCLSHGLLVQCSAHVAPGTVFGLHCAVSLAIWL